MRKKKAIVKKIIKKKVVSKRRTVAKTRNAGLWTEAMYWQKVRNALRNAFRYFQPMQNALKAASRPSQNKTNLRLKTEYQCAKCKNWFKRQDVQIDHLIGCGSLSCIEDIAPFLEKLTIENIAGYQILCKKDHAEKTKKENEMRKNERKIK